jgi:hypothetical protein
MTTLRQATASDFKRGITLISKVGQFKFTLRKEYSEGIWECNNKVHYTTSAEHYLVEA